MIDGREMETYEIVLENIVVEAMDSSFEELADTNVSMIGVERALSEAETSLLFVEFDAMESDVQTSVAQMMKGLAEGQRFDRQIGFTCEAGDAVVRAEPDLHMRVRSYSLDD